MSTAASLPIDTLSPLADADSQRVAARMAQDVFAGVFRKAFMPDPEQLGKLLAEVETLCFNWCQSADGEERRALRMALLISGLDQWGLAYTQAFNLTAIPALTALLGALRSRLNTQSDTLFQRYFNQLEQAEGDAIDFKVELRRSIHLALWHAMVACDNASEAQAILQPLGSMMLVLERQMPELGWRLLADALANIQISLLNDTGLATELARESTQQLFESLRHALPQARYQAIMAQSGQVVQAWQQARRSKTEV